MAFFVETQLKAGNHTCYFKAEDGNGGSVTTDTFWVVVSDDTDDGTEDPFKMGNMAIGIIVIIAVVVVALVLWSRSKSP